MELSDLVGKYGTQLKEKINNIYDNNKRKILIGTLGSSLLLNSGCLTTALVGGAAGGLPGAIVGSLAGDAAVYGKERRERDEENEENLEIYETRFWGERKPNAYFRIRAPPLDGSPMYLDVDKNGILDKIHIDINSEEKVKRLGKLKINDKRSKVYVEYGKPDGTFEKPIYFANTRGKTWSELNIFS